MDIKSNIQYHKFQIVSDRLKDDIENFSSIGMPISLQDISNEKVSDVYHGS